MLSRIGLRSIALGLVLGALAVAPATAAPHVDGEFPVSSIEANDKIVLGPDGNMWLTVSSATKNLAKITPTGAVEEFKILGGVKLTGIATGPEGNLWVTLSNGVAKFSPASPEAAQETSGLGISGNSNPIVAGPNGEMWVAALEKVLHFPPSDPAKAQEIAIAQLQPRDIDVAGSLLAIADFQGHQVITLTTSGEEKDYPVEGEPQGVAGNAEGQIAFSKQGGEPERVGLISPPNPAVATDVPATDPFGVALGSDHAYWIAQSNTTGVARLTTEGQLTHLGGFEAGMKPRQIAAGPDNTMWVTLENNEAGVFKVGRISGLEPPTTGGGPQPVRPETKITKGPRKRVVTTGRVAKVKFRFTSPSPGAGFECALTKLKNSKTKQRPPKFAACSSPKKYGLKPGRYRFEVRAVLDGQRDPTAAKRAFRVIHRG